MAGYGEERAEGELGKDKDDGDWGKDGGCFTGGEVSVWSVWSLLELTLFYVEHVGKKSTKGQSWGSMEQVEGNI